MITTLSLVLGLTLTGPTVGEQPQSGPPDLVVVNSVTGEVPVEEPLREAPTPVGAAFLTDLRTKLTSLGASPNVTIAEAKVVCGMAEAWGCASPEHIDFASRLAYESQARIWQTVAHEYAHVVYFRQADTVNAHPTYKSSFKSDPEHLADCMALTKGYTKPIPRYSCNQTQLDFSKQVWSETFVDADFEVKSFVIVGNPAPGNTLTTKMTPVDSRAKHKLGTTTWKVDNQTVSTATTYKVGAPDVGKTISVTQTFTHRQGTTQATAKTTATNKLNITTATRFGGNNRYATAQHIANTQQGGPVFLTSGEDFADALSASVPAGKLGGTIALTRNPTLNPQAKTIIQNGNGHVYIVGGTGAVSPNIEAQVKALGQHVTRIGGKDRYETSRKVVELFYPTADNVFIATGRDFPDALSAASVAGMKGDPLLLVTGKNGLDAASEIAVRRLNPNLATLVGGYSALSYETQMDLIHVAHSSVRFSGKDRYETNAVLARRMDFTNHATWVASGVSFPDALAASAPAGSQKTGLVLTKPTCMPQKAYAVLADSGVSSVKIDGGKSVVSDQSARGQKVC